VRFVDSHLHLSLEGVDQALSLASSSDMLLLTCGVDRETSLRGLRIAHESRFVASFVGVHPSEVHGEADLGWFQGALERADGAGEIGLDPKYSPIGPESDQTRAFHAQLSAAARLEKPVQVHSRDAVRECVSAVESHRLKSVLFHWFQDEHAIRLVQERGYFVSFGPSVLYSRKLQRMAADAEKTLVLTETDSPVTYGPLGGVSGSTLVPSVVFKLAELWKMPFDDARAVIAENAARYLGASKKG
jgi:TatD DNase family protein